MTMQTLKTGLVSLSLIIMITMAATPVEAHQSNNATWTCHRIAPATHDRCGDPNAFNDLATGASMDFENDGANDARVTITEYSGPTPIGVVYSNCVAPSYLGLTTGFGSSPWVAPNTMTIGQHFIVTWYSTCAGLHEEKTSQVCIHDASMTRSC